MTQAIELATARLRLRQWRDADLAPFAALNADARLDRAARLGTLGGRGARGESGPHIPVSPCVEIGWRIAAEHWGKGHASEAARAALRVGFAPRARARLARLRSVDVGEEAEHRVEARGVRDGAQVIGAGNQRGARAGDQRRETGDVADETVLAARPGEGRK